jgi:hypothetical protein
MAAAEDALAHEQTRIRTLQRELDWVASAKCPGARRIGCAACHSRVPLPTLPW